MTILRIITSSSTEKNWCDQPIDSGIKTYDENRKLTAIQGEDYPVGYLLDYEHIKIIIVSVNSSLVESTEITKC